PRSPLFPYTTLFRSDLVTSVTGFGSGLGAPAGIDTSWISANVPAAAAMIGIYDVPGGAQAGNMRNVKEEDIGIWAQLNFDMTMRSEEHTSELQSREN